MTGKIFLSFAITVLLSACGGGGSSVAPAPVDPPTESNMPIPVPYLISAYGDSTQEAQGQPHEASSPGAKVYNRGVSGTNSAQLLAGTDGVNLPWPEMMRVESAKIVVINHGINDRKRPIEDYKADLRALVDGIRKVGKVPMLEEPNPIDEHGFEAYRDAMRLVAHHTGVYHCDQPRVPLSDGIHPTTQGYAIKANRLKSCIKDVM